MICRLQKALLIIAAAQIFESCYGICPRQSVPSDEVRVPKYDCVKH